jgi:hypothetical protein
LRILEQFFGAAVEIKSETTPSHFNIDLGNMDEAWLAAIKRGDQWHSNLLKLTGSMVQRGMSDTDILAIAPEITLAGYTVSETEAEMRRMISGARQKGFETKTDTEVEIDLDDPLLGLSILSVDGLMSKTFPPIKWLVEPLLPQPSLTMIAGPPKVGKSWLCLRLALHLVENQHQIVYVANEDNERRLQSRLVSVNPFAPKGIFFLAGLSNEVQIPKGQRSHAFIKALKAKYPNLTCIVIDTFASIRAETPRGNKKDEYTLLHDEISALRRITYETGVSIILVHHTRKASDSDQNPVERLLGSQAIGATVDTIMVLKQAAGSLDVELHAKGKDIEQQDLLLEWQGPGFGWPKEITEAKLGQFQEVCLEFIRKHPRCTRTFLCEELNRDKSQVSRAVSRLIEVGFVEDKEMGQLMAK